MRANAIIVSFMLCLLSSCATTIYNKENPTQHTGLDFSKGKWLLGNIDTDTGFKNDLTEMVLHDFSAYLNDRIKSATDENPYYSLLRFL